LPITFDHESSFSFQYFIISDRNSFSLIYFEQSNDSFDEINNSSIFSSLTYQYNLYMNDKFDDWLSVNTFMHNYYKKQNFGYQIFHNNKDLNDPTIIY